MKITMEETAHIQAVNSNVPYFSTYGTDDNGGSYFITFMASNKWLDAMEVIENSSDYSDEEVQEAEEILGDEYNACDWNHPEQVFKVELFGKFVEIFPKIIEVIF